MVQFRVFRFDPEKDQKPYFDAYEIATEHGMTVLDGLISIFETRDPSLAYRASCCTALCGSCTMHINGRYRLACQTQIEDVAKNATVVVEPLRHLSVLRDLVVDMAPFFDQWQKAGPFVPKIPTPTHEHLQSPEQREKLNTLVDCIVCGACYAACPSARENPEYLGPHAMMRALRFIEDSRDVAAVERLSLVASDNGAFRCHTVFNCQTVCPKDLDPSSAITRIKKLAIKSTGAVLIDAKRDRGS